MDTHHNIEYPFSSPFIEKRLNEIKDRKSKNAFLESIMTDPSAVILNEINDHQTSFFQGNRGPKTNTWKQTKQMAFELNRHGFDVTFLTEPPYDICADSLIKKGNIYRIVDFKYCVTKKTNTLVMDLIHGFIQANTIVLKLLNMDSGSFKKAIEYLLRNKIPHGNIILINKYGRVIELSKKDIKTGIYKKHIKGFL